MARTQGPSNMPEDFSGGVRSVNRTLTRTLPTMTTPEMAPGGGPIANNLFGNAAPGQQIVPGTGTDLRQQVLGFNSEAPNIDPQNLGSMLQEAFQSQLPLLNENLREQTEQLAQRTSALGRSGSGMFNRDTDELSDRARAQRESLLGRLGFQAASTDVSNDLQAQRFNEMQRLNRDLLQRRFASSQQDRQDRLARQAMSDAAQRAQLLSQAFGMTPTATELAGAGEFGANAGTLAGQAGTIGQAGAEILTRPQDNTQQILESVFGSGGFSSPGNLVPTGDGGFAPPAPVPDPGELPTPTMPVIRRGRE